MTENVLANLDNKLNLTVLFDSYDQTGMDVCCFELICKML